MLSVFAAVDDENLQRAQAKLDLATRTLHELFERADSDGSMAVDIEEFQAMLRLPETSVTLRHNTAVTVDDLADLFCWLDKNKDGYLSIQEFLDGFVWLNEDFTQKSVLKMNGQLTKELLDLERRLLRQIEDSFEKFFQAVQDPVRKILVVTQQIQRVDFMLHGHAEMLTKACSGRLKRRNLEQTEARLMHKIAGLEHAVRKLDEMEAAGLVRLVDPRLRSTLTP